MFSSEKETNTLVLWTEDQLDQAISSSDINSIEEGLITGAILPVVSAWDNYLFRWLLVDNQMSSAEFKVLLASEKYWNIMRLLVEIESIQVDVNYGWGRLLSQLLQSEKSDHTSAVLTKLLTLENFSCSYNNMKKVVVFYPENVKLLFSTQHAQNILDELKNDWNRRDRHELLMEAVRENHIHVVRYFLTLPMFVEMLDFRDNCALRYASEKGFLEIVAMLLEIEAVRNQANENENDALLSSGEEALGAKGYNAWSGIFFLLMEQSNAAEGLRHLEHSTHYTKEKFLEKSQKILDMAKMPLEMIGYPIFREKRLQTVDSRRYFIQHQLSDFLSGFWKRIYVFVCGCYRLKLPSLPPELWGIIIEDYKYLQVTEPKAIPYLTSARKLCALLDQEQQNANHMAGK